MKKVTGEAFGQLSIQKSAFRNQHSEISIQHFTRRVLK
jgi:hypothetical protein